MARYKYIDTNPRFLAVDLARQLLPGTFEHALNHLLDHEIDVSHFDARFRNDETGATAYPPAMLLGGFLGIWFWFRWLSVPELLDYPFSRGRWLLIGVHVALIVTGLIVVGVRAFA
jgi:hypothetical protein